MKKDYHLHPNIINNPGQAEKFIKKAVESGFEEICFTDHMPFSITHGEFDRIPHGCVGEYCEKVGELAEKHKNEIIIKTGIEIDYHPYYTEEIKSVLSQGKFDYVLGSSHLNIAGYRIDFKNTTRTEFAKMVLNNYLCAVKSGMFNAISHLDVYRWVFSEKESYPLKDDSFDVLSCTDILKSIFSALENSGMFLEINAAPLYKGFDNLGFYPENKILDIAKQYKLKYIYGSDAHAPDKQGFGYDRITEITGIRL